MEFASFDAATSKLARWGHGGTDERSGGRIRRASEACASFV